MTDFFELKAALAGRKEAIGSIPTQQVAEAQKNWAGRRQRIAHAAAELIAAIYDGQDVATEQIVPAISVEHDSIRTWNEQTTPIIASTNHPALRAVGDFGYAASEESRLQRVPAAEMAASLGALASAVGQLVDEGLSAADGYMARVEEAQTEIDGQLSQIGRHIDDFIERG